MLIHNDNSCVVSVFRLPTGTHAVQAGEEDLLEYVRSKPTGKYARCLWFLYEFLTGKTLPLDDLKRGNYIDLADLMDLSLIHISEPTRLRRISYAVFCLKKKKNNKTTRHRADFQAHEQRLHRHEHKQQ